MTTSLPNPDTPPAGPTVCKCGYDLTGLPVDDDAKCPECGVVISTIKPPIEIDGRTVLATTIAFMPSIVAGTKVCTCGYNLTGLPADADTKCPECGVVISTIKPSIRITALELSLMAVAITPSVVVMCDPIIEVLYRNGILSQAVIENSPLLVLGWFLFASIPASVLLVRPSLVGKSRPKQLMAIVYATCLCFLVNMSFSTLAIWLMT